MYLQQSVSFQLQMLQFIPAYKGYELAIPPQ